MDFFGTIRKALVTTEQDLDQFVEDAWNELPAAAAKARAIFLWVANTGLPGFQKGLDATVPFMTAVSVDTGHVELGASLQALQVATHAVNAAVASAKGGTITVDQATAAVAALRSAESSFQGAKAVTAEAVAAAPMTGAKS